MGTRVFVRELSMVPVYPMVLFGGADGVSVELQRGNFVLSLENGWIKFGTKSHTVAECLKEMRSELDNLLEEKIRNPTLDLNTHARGKLVINTLVELLSKAQKLSSIQGTIFPESSIKLISKT